MDKVIINDGINPEFSYEIGGSTDGQLYGPLFHFWFGAHLYLINPSAAAELCVQHRGKHIVLLINHNRGILSIFLKDEACGVDLLEGANKYRVYMNEQQVNDLVECLREFVRQSI